MFSHMIISNCDLLKLKLEKIYLSETVHSTYNGYRILNLEFNGELKNAIIYWVFENKKVYYLYWTYPHLNK